MTKTTNQVYFNYDVSDFLAYTINRKDGIKAKNMQEMAEMIFDAVISGETPGVYDMEGKLEEAEAYLSKKLKNTLKKQNKIKLKDYQDEIESDITRAARSAWEASYQDEWIKKCYSLLYDAILKTACAATDDNSPTVEMLTEDKKWITLPAEITPDIWEAESVRFHTTAERVNALNDFTNMIDDVQDLADELTAYKSGTLDPYKITSSQYEGIDYYGTLGNDDDWMLNYKEEEETSARIIADVEEEQAKHGNADYLLAQISKSTADIRQVLAEYAEDKQYTEQILRAVGSIEATAKRATLK